jgi:endonuclease VIII
MTTWCCHDGKVPEGDTVYALARRLDTAMRDRVVTLGDLRVPAHATADLSGRTILDHATHGKHLLTRFSGDLTLHTHMKMSGSWTISAQGRWLPRSVMPDVRVVLRTDGPAAYGVQLPIVELVETSDEGSVIGHLGPDPLRDDWDIDEASRRLAADPDRPLAAALLDQRCVAGFGNLWANELCFLRGHSPWTRVGDVDVRALLELGARALRHSATAPGAMQVTTGNTRKGEMHWVAGRANRPCLRCGTRVRVVDEVPNDPEQRRTWWCPRCQPGPVGRFPGSSEVGEAGI